MPPSLDIKSIGAHEFHQQFATFIASDTPLAITQHGTTVGYYLPHSWKISPEALATARTSADRLEQSLHRQESNSEILIADAQKLRQERKKQAISNHDYE